MKKHIDRRPFIPYHQRPHIKSYKAKWYQDNKERRRLANRENVKRYALRHPDRVKDLKQRWDAANSSHIKDYRKKYYLSERVYTKNWRLEKLYGITLEHYEQLFDNQKGGCAICGVHQSSIKTPLHIDHDHKTKKVRGLLCHKCNRGIGLFQDSTDILQKAREYLERVNK